MERAKGVLKLKSDVSMLAEMDKGLKNELQDQREDLARLVKDVARVQLMAQNLKDKLTLVLTASRQFQQDIAILKEGQVRVLVFFFFFLFPSWSAVDYSRPSCRFLIGVCLCCLCRTDNLQRRSLSYRASCTFSGPTELTQTVTTALQVYMPRENWLVGNWILTSFQPHTVTSRMEWKLVFNAQPAMTVISDHHRMT